MFVSIFGVAFQCNKNQPRKMLANLRPTIEKQTAEIGKNHFKKAPAPGRA